MKEAKDVKMYFYVDESGDPNIVGRKGKNLLEAGTVSKTFIVGYVETEHPNWITRNLELLREEVLKDEYLQGIPSLSSTKIAFHANKDCHEVKERVFKLLKTSDYKAHVIVARKDEHRFRNKFGMDAKKLYEYLVSKLFENRLHLYKKVDIYFSAMGNVVREHNMRDAIELAIATFKQKWGKDNESEIRVFVHSPSQIQMLQVVDYTLWAVNKVYEKNDFRYYKYLLEKISLVQDVFDTINYPNIYYTPKNPLIKKESNGG